MLNIVEDLARSFGLLLDSLFYPLIVNLYNLFFNIVKITIANPDTIQKFAQRIYVLIAVFMIFKITVSMISWFASPDSVSDSNKGSSNLVKRIIISLLLLGSVNYIFNFAFRVQYIILNENLIGNIIMGNSTQANFQDTVMKGGDMVATSVFQGFFFPENTTQDEEEMYHKRAEQNNWSLFSSYAMSVVNKRNGEDYAFHYQAYVSTIAGLVVAWILLIFCIDMAVRCVTLGFLQIIAPVPILSYIDQKKGEKVFNNWLQTCISTYLEVFVKLIAIFFGIFLIGELLAHDLLQYNSEGNAIPYDSLSGYFPRMFIIVGILIFVGKLPQLVADMLGVKKMDFTLNPLKKLGASGFVGAAAGLGLGALTGGIGSAMAKQGGLGSKVLAGLGGAFGGGFRGMTSGYGSKDKFLSNAIKSGAKSTANTIKNGDTRMTDRALYRMQNALGLKNQKQVYDDQIAKHENLTKMMDQLKAQADFNKTDISTDAGFASIARANTQLYYAAASGAKGLKQYLSDLTNSGRASVSEIQQARSAYEYAREQAITNGDNGGAIDAIKDQMQRYVDANRDTFSNTNIYGSNLSSFKDFNDASTNSKTEIVNIKTSQSYAQAEQLDKATSKK